MRKSKLSEDQKQFLVQNYPKLGGRKCAEILFVPIEWIQSFCEKRRITLDKEVLQKIRISSMEKAHAVLDLKKKDLNFYDVDPRKFTNPNSPEVAYILGLLWADGYVRKSGSICIEAVKSDLELIFPIFLKTGNWLINYRNREGKKPQARIHKNNIIISKFLFENDYQSKSAASACKILSKIPEHLQRYWFRGLVDGDGCFYFNEKSNLAQFSIASSFEQNWTFVENIMNKLQIKYAIKPRKQLQNGKINGSSVIRITNRKDIKTFGDYIYQNYENDKIGLQRKYEKFLKIKSMIKD